MTSHGLLKRAPRVLQGGLLCALLVFGCLAPGASAASATPSTEPGSRAALAPASGESSLERAQTSTREPRAQEAGAQEPTPDPRAQAAQELWQRVCAATLLGSHKNAKPITALDLRFELLSRNQDAPIEIKPRVIWLSPSFIRIQTSSDTEQVRGPDGDWLREGDKVIRLQGREYITDRRLADEYLTLIHNFVALTHPKTLAVENLTLVDEPPFDFPLRHDLNRPRDRKQTAWLRFESADLQLEPADDWSAPAKQRIHVAVDTTTSLPTMAFVESTNGKFAPMFLALSDTRTLDDLRVPHQVHVYAIEPSAPGNPRAGLIAEQPMQELNIIGGTVRARLNADSFRLPK